MKTATLSGIIFAGLTVQQAQAGNFLSIEDEMNQSIALQGDAADEAGRRLAGSDDDQTDGDEGVEALLEAVLEQGSEDDDDDSSPSDSDSDRAGKKGWGKGKKGWGGKGKKGWGKKHGFGGKRGMMMARMFGAFGKKGFNEERYQQLMDKVEAKVAQMGEKKLEWKAKFLGKVCDQLEGDQEGCSLWADAVVAKARAHGTCKRAAKKDMGLCMGDYLRTAASFFTGSDSSNDDGEAEEKSAAPALTSAEVGQCYATSLDNLNTCAVDASVAVRAAMAAVDEPEEEALQAAMKAVKKELKKKWAGKMRKHRRGRRGRRGRVGGRRGSKGGYRKGGYRKGGSRKGGYRKGGSYGQKGRGGYSKGGSYGQKGRGGYSKGDSYGQKGKGGRGGYYGKEDYDQVDSAYYKGGY